MPDDASFPTVPEARLRDDGWELTDETVETVFELSTASVVGATRLYGDSRTREAALEATDIDRQWRFFFATALTFRPPLTPGIGPAMILPTVRSEAQSTFADELRNRGFEDVERGRRERVRTDSGDRARLRTYTASLSLDGVGATLSITGWVGVWHGDGFRIAAGAYPNRPVAEILDLADAPAELERSPQDYRDELLDLIRAVE
ncbi:hypothetical protein [Haloarcula nitratireducens]|uniref:Uncharacterized protein n=1 Tax=Haloarcula nitratireducens TaxID=2487749 RepID=A0AAW4P6R3_9EURY|nr:hypothetical protein [Halomicroarcula nitratireducens]MBX0293559.1 hypothetical protein [Halomicroarcula nitratireducens]